jgi:hypothetical protein
MSANRGAISVKYRTGRDAHPIVILDIPRVLIECPWAVGPSSQTREPYQQHIVNTGLVGGTLHLAYAPDRPA